MQAGSVTKAASREHWQKSTTGTKIKFRIRDDLRFCGPQRVTFY